MCRVRWVCLGVLILGLSACSADKGFATREVNRDEYGTKWPLTVDRAVLACEPGDVATLTVDGQSYGLAGVTSAHDVPGGFRRIWAKVPEPGSGSRSDLSPLVGDALALCD